MWAMHALAGTGLHVCRQPVEYTCAPVPPEAAKPGWLRAPGTRVLGRAGRRKRVEANLVTLLPPL